MKFQTLTLKTLYEHGGEMTLDEISREAGARYWQVHSACRQLIRRGLVLRTPKNRKARKFGVKSLFKINEIMIPRIIRVINKKEDGIQ